MLDADRGTKMGTLNLARYCRFLASIAAVSAANALAGEPFLSRAEQPATADAAAVRRDNRAMPRPTQAPVFVTIRS
jgi:hypothetical protein